MAWYEIPIWYTLGDGKKHWVYKPKWTRQQWISYWKSLKSVKAKSTLKPMTYSQYKYYSKKV